MSGLDDKGPMDEAWYKYEISSLQKKKGWSDKATEKLIAINFTRRWTVLLTVRDHDAHQLERDLPSILKDPDPSAYGLIIEIKESSYLGAEYAGNATVRSAKEYCAGDYKKREKDMKKSRLAGEVVGHNNEGGVTFTVSTLATIQEARETADPILSHRKWAVSGPQSTRTGTGWRSPCQTRTGRWTQLICMESLAR